LFLDANVLFTAAHNPDGKAAFVISQSAPGRWQVLSSDYAIEEARRNLQRKFPDSVADLKRLLADVEIVKSAGKRLHLPALPEKDQPIYATARAAHATHLLTGDIRDFGPYMNAPEKTGGIMVQTVADFLDSLV
jgi:predicted nucleic acid-binding protein